MVNSIEKFLQIQIHHPLIALLYVAPSLRYRRLTTPVWTKPMARFMERWLIHRFKYQPYRLLYHAIHHVWDTQTSLSASRFRYPHAPYISGTVAPIQQGNPQFRNKLL